jgi:hypothetical protein
MLSDCVNLFGMLTEVETVAEVKYSDVCVTNDV